MKDYLAVISEVLVTLGKEFSICIDANLEIDSKIPNDFIDWYPPYLVICEGIYYMFRPFVAESFIDDDEIKKHCVQAKHLVTCLNNKNIRSKVFFITNTIADVEALEKQDLSQEFGMLHNELEKPLLDFTITNTFNLQCKLLYQVLEYLKLSMNLKGQIAEVVKMFATQYLTERPTGEEELRLIKDFLSKVLNCDDRFRLAIDSIDFMANFEKLISVSKRNNREHYFHAINTMMIGFMILDKHYTQFGALIKDYGDDIVLEFLWVLIALHHDIGYPVAEQRYSVCNSYGLSLEENHILINDCLKELRQKIWASAEYQFIVDVLNNLFHHVYKSIPGKWTYDGFVHHQTLVEFKRSVEKAFIEDESHGASGTIKLALLTNPNIKHVTEPQVREFIYRHILFASVSILFHDSKVRMRFRENAISNIEAKSFPLACLLTYADILQDDRRDMTGSLSRADIFKDICIIDGKIKAILEEAVLTTALCQKLLNEFVEAMSFFLMNGISFLIPEEIKNECTR